MVWMFLLIPILTIVAQYLYCRKKIHPLEYVLQLLVPCLLILLGNVVANHFLTRDVEYRGGWVNRAIHKEAWNEYVHNICTETDSDGNVRVYDCSYVKYHPERYYIEDSNGRSHYINEDKYYSLVSKFNNESKIGTNVGYTISGDIMATNYPGGDTKMECVVTQHIYTNRVLNSNSVFNYRYISKDEAKEIGLFNYPNDDYLYTPSVLGYKNSHKLDVLNAKLGASKQIRVWVLVYKNQPSSIFEDQRNYWQNGNKNELIIGIGLDKDKVSWSNIMTWCENDSFNVKARDIFAEQIGKTFNLDLSVPKLYNLIDKEWKRKQFADFDYLRIELPFRYMLIIFLATCLINSSIAYIFIVNDLDSED